MMSKSLVGKKQKVQAPPILQFQGYYEFLSIDYPCWVYYQGFLFPSVATAFQAARSNDATLRRKISEVKDQEQLKKLMSEIKNPTDWPQRRVRVMEQLNRDKFKRNRELGLKLFATQARQLVNGYPHGGDAEAFWGAVDRKGELQGLNTLGNILTNLRQEILTATDSAKWVEDQNIEQDPQLWPQVNLVSEHQNGDVDSWPLHKKGRFILGWNDQCEVRLEQSYSSKFHAAIYFSSDMEVVIVDLNSTQGTRILRNNQQTKLQPLRPQSLQNGDILLFGASHTRHIIYISYEQVEARIAQQKAEAAAELERIAKLKQLQAEAAINQQRAAEQRSSIRSLLQLKHFSCLYVENINRNFTYKDIRETFNQYGPTKNIRINIDQRTGRFMGSVLIYFADNISVNQVLENIRMNPIKYDFRVVAVSAEEAEQIIATFTNKELQEKQRTSAQQSQPQQNSNNRHRKMADSSRRRSPSSSSSSSSSSSPHSSRSRSRRHDRSHNK